MFNVSLVLQFDLWMVSMKYQHQAIGTDMIPRLIDDLEYSVWQCFKFRLSCSPHNQIP